MRRLPRCSTAACSLRPGGPPTLKERAYVPSTIVAHFYCRTRCTCTGRNFHACTPIACTLLLSDLLFLPLGLRIRGLCSYTSWRDRRPEQTPNDPQTLKPSANRNRGEQGEPGANQGGEGQPLCRPLSVFRDLPARIA